MINKIKKLIERLNALKNIDSINKYIFAKDGSNK